MNNSIKKHQSPLRNFKDAYIGTDGGKRLSFILCNVFYGIGSDLKLSIPTYILHAKFIEIDDAIFRNKREFEKRTWNFIYCKASVLVLVVLRKATGTEQACCKLTYIT